MPFESELYPAQWRAIRHERLQRAGYCCEECGVRHLSIRQNTRTGSDYMVYLSIAHKQQYQTWKKDAETMVLCQRCHRRYDRQFRRKGSTKMYTPVGYAKVYVQSDENEALAGMPRTYAELRDVVLALPDGAQFEVQLVMNVAIVGNGVYRKDGDQIEVIAEYGACQDLPLI